MGQEVKHTHEVIGYQQRLDPLQAAILSVKLRYLDRWVDQRQAVAGLYNELLADLPLDLPQQADWAKHAYYMYTVRLKEREALYDYLSAHGIGSQKIYATPVPLQPCYRYLEYSEEDLPVSVKYANELLCLPVFPELRADEVAHISKIIHQFFEREVK